MEKFLDGVNSVVWGPAMLALLFGTHLYLTFRLRFIQRHLWKALKLSFRRETEGAGDISHFGALMTALAATIGTGNIVGVATAVSLGGPGAVLWMWLTGVFGIATKYSEALLAIKYRVTAEDGTMAGGPMYALERGMNARWLGLIFAAMTAIAAFGIGNMVQANSIAGLMKESFNIPPWVSGIVVTALTALVILGGIKSIARTCEKLVPFMAVSYVLGCLVLMLFKFETIPGTLALIFQSAFSGQAALGGFAGAGMKEAMRYGVARGLFSNESGMGSAPIVAAAARTKNPVRQALVSSTGTFWDTVVICALTGIVLVNSGHWAEGLKGAALTKAAFSDIPYAGHTILVVGLFTFVFSTILGWSYYGEKAVEYLFGTGAVKYYLWLWVAAVMLGSVGTMPSVWAFADIANAAMAIPNLVSLLALNKVLVSETRRYLWENRLEELGS
ncbi:MAG: transporter [Elusimicrobia bacterium GWA2_56_46]|nr:MAG: transporter [Elusimicrobia bacterium GWA2_56_46]OGR55225.1 MAG: transporter [Elusimicrobia bacterium GWC2_56_31]HBW22295.1 sodium:alanine symporter family protein [Elusimicrobiota bacterium]